MTITPAHAPGTRMTANELLTLRDDGQRHDLVRGELRVYPPPGARHGYVGVQLFVRLQAHVTAARLGMVFFEVGFVLARDPDTVRGPDVSFLSAARIPASGIPDGYFEGPPDLAVEVISPTDRLYDVEEKVDEYLAAGTPLVWVVNPKRRTVTVHAPGADPRVLGQPDTLDGGDVVPGFRCEVREIVG
jgi:Uma2 family endonuclease